MWHNYKTNETRTRVLTVSGSPCRRVFNFLRRLSQNESEAYDKGGRDFTIVWQDFRKVNITSSVALIFLYLFFALWASFRIYIWQVFPYSPRVSHPSGSSLSTQVIGTLLHSCCQGKGRIGLCSTAGTEDPDEGDMICLHVCTCAFIVLGTSAWACAYVHVFSCLCVFMCEYVCVHIGEGPPFQSAGWQTVSWLMSSCRPSLFMSPVTHLLSQSTSTWNPETQSLSLVLQQRGQSTSTRSLWNTSISSFYNMTIILKHV